MVPVVLLLASSKRASDCNAGATADVQCLSAFGTGIHASQVVGDRHHATQVQGGLAPDHDYPLEVSGYRNQLGRTLVAHV